RITRFRGNTGCCKNVWKSCELTEPVNLLPLNGRYARGNIEFDRAIDVVARQSSPLLANATAWRAQLARPFEPILWVLPKRIGHPGVIKDDRQGGEKSGFGDGGRWLLKVWNKDDTAPHRLQSLVAGH